MLAYHKPDAVINTAAMTNVDACEDDRENCWDINVNAVKYLLQSSKKHGCHLIHLSTDFVFDGEEGPYEEKDKPNPSEKTTQESIPHNITGFRPRTSEYFPHAKLEHTRPNLTEKAAWHALT